MDNATNNLTTKEEQLFTAAKDAEEKSKKEDVKRLKEKYAGSGEKIYAVTNTIQIDDDNEEEFTFLFRKPKPASYDRYIKTISNSASRASKAFAFDNIVEEQKDELNETLEEYPAMAISLAEKLLHMLGLADSTTVKKL